MTSTALNIVANLHAKLQGVSTLTRKENFVELKKIQNRLPHIDLIVHHHVLLRRLAALNLSTIQLVVMLRRVAHM